MTDDFSLWVNSHHKRIESFMMQILKEESSNSLIHEVCSYGSINGGKRFRALLSYAIGEITQTDKLIIDHIASSIEFIHAYSLIHDDLPAMDNDDLRRGKPTCHIKFNEAQAILAGDGLQSLAFHILSLSSFLINDQKKLKLINSLSNTIGINGMVKGQSLDIENTLKIGEIKGLEKLQELKTGLLFNFIGSATCLVSDNHSKKMNIKITNLCALLGKVYQITDDILDYESNDKILGKTSGKDRKDNKLTYVSLLGINEAKKINSKYFDDIKEIINSISGNTIFLNELILKIYQRAH
ncbi:polyprenyl synthetase family protein [Methylophilaceae bacterium]|nr:polyprenyl synthetase family protein [Methylophilaceae bacterium]